MMYKSHVIGILNFELFLPLAGLTLRKEQRSYSFEIVAVNAEIYVLFTVLGVT